MDESNRRHLLEIWRRLPPGDRHSWIQFGDFLLSRATPPPPVEPPEPTVTPGPPGETTIQAIKRLRKCYAVMESDASLLDEATHLMTQRIFGSTDAVIIPLIEALFEKKYRQWVQTREAPPQSL